MSGYEAGLGLTNYNDIKEGDLLEAYILKEVENNRGVNMNIKRTNRISEEVRKIVSELILNGLKDPRI